MKIVVINLKTAAERHAAAARQLAGLGLEFSFFEAIEGSVPAAAHFRSMDEARYRLNTLRAPLPGEIGCFASHLALWKMCVADNEPLVVMEDDFGLEPRFRDAIREVARLIDTFGFIRLQSIDRKRALSKRWRAPAHKLMSAGGFDLLYVSDVPLCMLAYAISPKAAASLIAASACLYAPVDKFLQQTWLHKTPIYALSPPVVVGSEQGCVSTIGRRGEKRRDPGLLLARAVHKAFGEIRRIAFDRKHRVGAAPLC